MQAGSSASITRIYSSGSGSYQPASQPFFAFEREDPHTGRKTQLTWTRLPQGFKSSPTLFGEALAEDLAAFHRETLDCTLPRYVHVLLLASPTQGTAGEAPKPCWLFSPPQGTRCHEKGSDLYIGGQVPGVCHLKRASGTGTGGEASHLLTTSAEHQERSL